MATNLAALGFKVDFTLILAIFQLLQRTWFQTYFLILSQINSKNYQFHTLFLRSNLQMGIRMKVISSVWAEKKNDEKYQFCIWFDLK